MRVAIVGCGFVADMYIRTLLLHPELELVGACDRDPDCHDTDDVSDSHGRGL